jgi:hypothetical protein
VLLLPAAAERETEALNFRRKRDALPGLLGDNLAASYPPNRLLVHRYFFFPVLKYV